MLETPRVAPADHTAVAAALIPEVKTSDEPAPEPKKKEEKMGDKEANETQLQSEPVVSQEPQDVKEQSVPAKPEKENEEDFATCWNTMFEEMFSGHPMIYYTFKDILPVYEDGVIKIEVQNEFQKNQYEMRKRALVEYWRAHFKINLDDVEIICNENMETKKIIYSAEDKMENLKEQNEALQQFLKVLKFDVKDE